MGRDPQRAAKQDLDPSLLVHPVPFCPFSLLSPGGEYPVLFFFLF